MSNIESTPIVIDTHVHFYQSWGISLDSFLSTAFTNLCQHSSEENTLPVIFLLENPLQPDTLRTHLLATNHSEASTWQTQVAEHEPWSIWATCKNKTMLIVMGYQIITAEGLELLLIGDTATPHNGEPVRTTLKFYGEQENVLSILPWAVGKWLGKRGSVVSELLESQLNQLFVLADNAGRPRLWSNIAQFNSANKKQIPILAGSDPLPIHGQHIKSGCYANLLTVDIDTQRPFNPLASAITAQNFKTVGKVSTPSKFLLNQIKLRLT